MNADRRLIYFWRKFWSFQRHNNGFAVIMRFYERHFSPMGKALFLLFILSLSLGLVGTDVLVYIMMSSLISLWLGVFVVGYLYRPQELQQLRVLFPQHVRAQQPCALEVGFVYRGPRTLFHTQTEIQLLTPDGEIERVLSALQVTLTPQQTVQTRFSWTPQQRGKVKVLGVSLISRFPLNLVIWRKHHKLEIQRWVYPPLRLIQKPRWQDRMRPLWLSSGDTGTSRGDSLEFFGIRPWQPGDSPRHLYWPALARTGQLAVREYQQSDGHRIALILDLHYREPARFETAVSLMAGLIQQIMSDPAHRLSLAWVGKSLHLPQRGQLKLGSLMLALAQVQTSSDFHFEYWLQDPMHWQHISAVICISECFGPRQLWLQGALGKTGRHVQFYLLQESDSPGSDCLYIPPEGPIAV